MNEDNPETIERKRAAFALARAMVEKASGLPADAAAAWLYERIREGSIETWQTPFRPADPNGERPWDRREDWLPIRKVTWIERLPSIARDGFIKGCEVVVADVDREIARAFLQEQQGAAVNVKNPRNAGAKPDPKFEPAMAMVGAWLADNGEQPEPKVRKYIQECLALRQESADPKTLEKKAKIALGAYREYRGMN